MEKVKRLEVAGSKSIAPLFNDLLVDSAGMGFEFISFWGMEGDEAAVRHSGCSCFAASWPDEFARRYVEHAYHEIDPLVYLAPASDGAINWDSIKGMNCDLFGEAAAFGLRDGVTIPLHVGKRVYLISFSTSQGIAVCRDKQSALESMAFRFLQDYMRAERQAGIGDREETDAKILPMAIAGYTQEAIADFLGIEERYVSASLRNTLGNASRRTICGEADRSSRMISIPLYRVPTTSQQQ
ncbi:MULTISPECIES: autoinducer binding domain-containing protein [unclassified Haematospirillum]|uniref:autoinducer binding domain-containing protein n=1 Tax=unclassified Haematospirillum TaxID=2622088 RepID=UPI00143AA840|nr:MULTISPECIES: autoinducer binding domain-containing protein [unclassified Haematospirillum]NKD54672.1 hypothetical protein [Haematospirillum sp. H4890]NKD74716.1 hypothetical protein [Haematospirillum sp. H4485]NKD87673.1 hypothetical protein [Haematospirillum sp. 15-248]